MSFPASNQTRYQRNGSLPRGTTVVEGIAKMAPTVGTADGNKDEVREQTIPGSVQDHFRELWIHPFSGHLSFTGQ
jgi:hypothetical protein